jgi:cation-transporting ATPase F
MLSLQIAYTYVPAMNAIFQSAPIDLETWLRILTLAGVAHVIIELDKWIRRTFRSKPRKVSEKINEF